MSVPIDTPSAAYSRWLASSQALWFIVGLAAVLRLYGLGTFSLWYDEGASLYLGQYLTTPWVLFEDAKNTEPPVNALMTGLWAGLITMVSPTQVTDSAHDFLLRLLPCLIGVLNCVLIHRVTRRLYDCGTTANAAALLFAIAPFQLCYAQELRIYGLFLTLTLLAVWAMENALSKNRVRDWAGYVAALTLVMYSHYFGMWLIFTLNAVFVLRLQSHHRLLWRWTAVNALLMVLIAPMLYRAFVMHAEVQAIEIPWHAPPTWKTGLITVKTFFAGYGPTRWAYAPLFFLGVGLLAWGALRKDGHVKSAVTIVSLVGIPIAGSLWVWGRADFSFYEHRLFLFSGAAALIGVARGVVLLGRLGLVLLGVFILLTVPCLVNYYRGDLSEDTVHRIAMWDKVAFRDAARALDAQWEAGDRLAYTSHFSAYSMFHYFSHEQVRLGWDREDEVTFVRLMGHESLLREHHLMPVPKEMGIAGATRIWLLSTHGYTFEWAESTERLFKWLEAIGRRRETLTFDGVSVTCFELPRQETKME